MTEFVLLIVLAIYFYLCSILKLGLNAKKILHIFGAIFLVCLVTFRSAIFPDTQHYEQIFGAINENKFYDVNFFTKDSDTGIEFGFLSFVWIIKRFISTNPKIIFCIIAIIQVTGFKCLIKKIEESKDVDCSDYYYMIFPYFGILMMFVTIRVGVAFVIALNAMFLKRKNKILCAINKLILYFLAFTFHRISILFLVIEMLALVFNKAFSKKSYIIVNIFSLIIVFFNKYTNAVMVNLLKLISENFSFLNYSNYLETEVTFGIPIRAIFFILLNFIMVYFYYSNIKNSNKCWLLNIVSIGSLITGLICSINAASRIYDCFNVVSLLMFGWILNKQNKGNVVSLIVKILNMSSVVIVWRVLLI